MANIKITDLTAYTDAASTDVLPIVDVGADVTKKITIGNVVKAVPLGTAALPGLAFDGDPNSGVYSPGADQVAISTNGTGRLFIDASGNVGVGATGPIYPLHVEKNQEDLLALVNAGVVTYRFQVKNDASLAIVQNAAERLRITSTGTLMHLGAGNSTTPAVQFNGSAPVNSLVMDSSGRVGLGTSSAQTKLDIGNNFSYGTASSNVIRLGASFAGGTPSLPSSIGAITWGNNDVVSEHGRINVVMLDPSTTLNSRMEFWINDSGMSQAMTLTPTGLGIGTTASTVPIEVAGPSGDNVIATFRSGDATAANNAGGGFRSISSATATSRVAQLWLDADGANLSGGDYFIIQKEGNSGTTTLNQFSNAAMAFKTNDVERARIDSSGRLLVGTSSTSGNITANDKLAVVITGDDTRGGISVTEYAGTSSTLGSNACLRLQRSIGTTDGSFTALTASDWGLGRIEFNGSNGSGFGTGATIEGIADTAAWSSGDHPARLVFSTTADGASSPTERMKIDNAGQIVFNSATYGLRAQTGSAAGTTIQIFSGFHSATGMGTGTACIYIHSNGNVVNTNNSYGAISDAKLKENIVDANSQWDDLKAIQVRNYNFREGQTHTQLGVVAQEVELVSPGLVSESPDRDEDGNDLGTVTKSVNYSVLYMKAVKALQEAMERIEQLETEMAAVKAQLS
jgi:hypothetical protein